MPFLLKCNEVDTDDSITLDSPVILLDGYRVEFRMKYDPSGGGFGRNWLRRDSSNRVYFESDRASIEVNGNQAFGAAGSLTPYVNKDETFIVRRTGNVYDVMAQDGTKLVSVEEPADLSFSSLCEGFVRAIIMDYYGATVYDNTDTPIHRWIPTGTGNTIPDTIGGNTATLNNFPTDDSQYEAYSAVVPSQQTVSPEQNIAWLLEDLPAPTGAWLQDQNSNQYALTSIADSGGAVPALSANLQACLFGDVTLYVTNGTKTVSAPITLVAPAGYNLTTLTSVPVTPLTTDWVYDFDVPASIGEQSLENDPDIEHLENGTITGVQAKTYDYFTITQAGMVSEITKTFEPEGGQVTPEPEPITQWLTNAQGQQELFTYDATLDGWLGSNKFTNPNITTNATVNEENGNYTVTGPVNNSYAIFSVGGVGHVGKSYRVKFEATFGGSSGRVNARMSGPHVGNMHETGTYSSILNGDSSSTAYITAEALAIGDTVTISDIELKEFISAADAAAQLAALSQITIEQPSNVGDPEMGVVNIQDMQPIVDAQQAAIETKIDQSEAALKTESDENQTAVAALAATVTTLSNDVASLTNDVATLATLVQNEHDATQAALASSESTLSGLINGIPFNKIKSRQVVLISESFTADVNVDFTLSTAITDLSKAFINVLHSESIFDPSTESANKNAPAFVLTSTTNLQAQLTTISGSSSVATELRAAVEIIEFE